MNNQDFKRILRHGDFADLDSLSPREAIACYCLDCSGYSVTEAANCEVRSCPLWQYRRKHKIERRQK